MLDVPLVRNNPRTTLADLASNFRTLRMPTVDMKRARVELTESPFYKDLVVSEDGTVASLAVYFKPHIELPRLRRLRDQLLYQELTKRFNEATGARIKTFTTKIRSCKRRS